MRYKFPKDFIWGAATAAYQVEGAAKEDGRKPSIWDTYADIPGNVADGSTGAVACDQYHLYKSDIELMKKLGINSYRLSISWSRIISDSDGTVNQKGLDHYKRVLETLHENGISSLVTCNHADLPQFLQDDFGGWAGRDTAYRFGDYVDVLARNLGDLVDIWATLNEPWCAAFLGYGNGSSAPGISDYSQAMAAVHHLNMAHGLGASAIRSVLGNSHPVGTVLNLASTYAASNDEKNQLAKELSDLMANETFLGPLLEGKYDPRIKELTQSEVDWSFLRDRDLEIIHQPIDFLGINYYSTTTVEYDDSGANTEGRNPMPGLKNVKYLPPKGELTAMEWNQDPEGLIHLVSMLSQRFPDLNLLITENGSAWEDPAPIEGVIHDPKRVSYLANHIKALSTILESGQKVKGYYAWSLLDNFEWGSGYSKRFGLLGVNYETQQRIWKDSSLWYHELISSHTIPTRTE